MEVEVFPLDTYANGADDDPRPLDKSTATDTHSKEIPVDCREAPVASTCDSNKIEAKNDCLPVVPESEGAQIVVTNLDDGSTKILVQSPIQDTTITPLVADSSLNEENTSVVDLTIDSSCIELESTNLASYSEHDLIAAGFFNDVDSVLDLTAKIEHWNPYSMLSIDDDDDGIS